MLVFFIIIILGGCVAAARFYVYIQMRNLSNILSEMLKQKEDSTALQKELKDSMESKIVYQCMKLMNIMDAKRRDAQAERESVKRLIADISHQLKTPLSNIKLNLDLLSSDALNEVEEAEFLNHTKQQTEKIEWLLNSLIKISRLENGVIHFITQKDFISKTIQMSIQSVYGQASKKNIELILEEFEDIKLLHNIQWTSEAVVNILDNAIKYSKRNSKILIRVVKMELYAQIQIQDFGAGIRVDEYNKIFQRFYRGESAKGVEGSGIGLYLANLILEKENGYITVKSNKGQGSTFSICLFL